MGLDVWVMVKEDYVRKSAIQALFKMCVGKVAFCIITLAPIIKNIWSLSFYCNSMPLDDAHSAKPCELLYISS